MSFFAPLAGGISRAISLDSCVELLCSMILEPLQGGACAKTFSGLPVEGGLRPRHVTEAQTNYGYVRLSLYRSRSYARRSLGPRLGKAIRDFILRYCRKFSWFRHHDSSLSPFPPQTLSSLSLRRRLSPERMPSSRQPVRGSVTACVSSLRTASACPPDQEF